MDIPLKLTLFGCEWGVKLVDGLIDDHNQYGMTNFQANVMSLDRSLPVDMQWTTLVHEVIHVVNHCLALEFDEDTVCRLDAGLGQFVLQLVGGQNG